MFSQVQLYFTGGTEIDMVSNLIPLVIGLAILILYGNGDLSRTKQTLGGNFKVGFTEYHVKVNGCAVSVFYPTDQDTPEFIKTVSVLRYG